MSTPTTTIEQFNHQQDVASRQPAREDGQPVALCPWCGGDDHTNCGPILMPQDDVVLVRAFQIRHRGDMQNLREENIRIRRTFQELLNHIAAKHGLKYEVFPETGEWRRVA